MNNNTVVNIDLDNLENNIKVIRNKYNEYRYFIAVLKASAYGHGEYIVNTLEKNNINYVAVSVISEALNIREYSKKVNILILEPISISDLNPITCVFERSTFKTSFNKFKISFLLSSLFISI